MTLVWMHGCWMYGCPLAWVRAATLTNAQGDQCDVCTRSCTHLVLGYALRHAGQRLLDVVQPAGATPRARSRVRPEAFALGQLNQCKRPHSGARDDQGFRSGPSMSVLPTCTTHQALTAWPVPQPFHAAALGSAQHPLVALQGLERYPQTAKAALPRKTAHAVRARPGTGSGEAGWFRCLAAVSALLLQT